MILKRYYQPLHRFHEKILVRPSAPRTRGKTLETCFPFTIYISFEESAICYNRELKQRQRRRWRQVFAKSEFAEFCSVIVQIFRITLLFPTFSLPFPLLSAYEQKILTAKRMIWLIKARSILFYNISCYMYLFSVFPVASVATIFSYKD